LKYALTYREVISILMQRHIQVDGKVRTDKTYPAGFMGESVSVVIRFQSLAIVLVLIDFYASCDQ